MALLAAPQLSDPAGGVAVRVAEALAPELGWSRQRIDHEVERFHREAEAEGIALGMVR